MLLKMHVDEIFSLAKAFDCINHTILLTMLYFGGATESWFKS
jgi:hypothetical protein